MRDRRTYWLPPLSGERRWSGRIAWGLWGLLLAAILVMRIFDPMGDQGFVNVVTMLCAALVVAVGLLWFLFSSGHRFWLRVTPLLVTAVSVFAFSSVFRFEAVSGAFVPRFAPRSAVAHDRTLETPRATPAARIDLATATADDFPQFLGPDRDLRLARPALARDWQARAPELVWRREIGAGWSGFAVRNGYAVTLEQRGDVELVTAYEVATGELRWVHAIPGRYESPIAGIGPRSTPTIDEGIVYAQGATGLFVALDGADGSLLWQRDLLAEVGMSAEQETAALPYGRSGSPLVTGELVILPGGGPPGGPHVSLLAFDKKTGTPAWRGGEQQISCSSPAIATLGGRRQVLIVNESSVAGHDVATGDELWRHPWEGRSNANASVSQPVPVPPDRVFVSKGYAVGAALLKLVPRAGGFDVRELWHESRVLRTKFTNVAIRDGWVYGLSDGILECVELATGERAWKAGRYGHGQILLVGDLLLVLSEDGEVFLVEATPERRNRVLGSFQAIEGQTWNNFALTGSRLLVRNAREAACYALPLAG